MVKEITVTVNPVLQATITGTNGPVCPSSQSTFTAPAGSGYLWSVSGNGSIPGSTTGQSVNVVAGADCNATFELTLNFTDPNGCLSTAQKTVSVVDNTPPVLSGCPSAVLSIECISNLPAPAGVTALDACSGTVTVNFLEVQTIPGGSCNNIVTRTWTASDVCGNTSTCTQTITVNDITPPSVTGCPSPETIEAPAEPVFGTPVFADNCDLTLTITPNDVRTPGTCAGSYSITRTWTATDDCGLSAVCSQTITVSDTEGPVLSGCPTSNPVVQCYEDVPEPATVTALDANGGVIDVVFSEIQTNLRSSCNNVITRTWTATDACGNPTSCSQTITVNDTEAPVVSNCPQNVNIECPAIPSFGTPQFTDNCDTSLEISFEDVITPGNCVDKVKQTVTRTWTAEDDCGLSVQCSQTITVKDLTAPVLTGCPAPTLSIQCISDLQSPAEITALDACEGVVAVSFNETQSNPGGSCNNIVIRTWTASDACGNESTCSQTITINDTQPPTVTSCPQDATIECPDTPVFGTPVFSDTCDPLLTVTFEDVTTPGNCINKIKETVTRTWTAKDDCNNQVTCNQTITVEDRTAPVLSGCPAPTLSLQSIADLPEPAIVTAFDACEGEIQVEFNETQSVPVGSCNNVIIRTWTATDACGNLSSCTQTITVNDTQPPIVLSCPQDATIECPGTPVFGEPLFSDNADASLEITHADVITPGNCVDKVKQTVTRTWTAKDECNNQVTCSQTITIEDNAAPVLTGCPAPTLSIQCIGDLPAPADVTALDGCEGTIRVSLIEIQSNPGGTCNNIITRNWTATDACGNASSCTQTITVNDIIPPTVTSCPQDATIECPATPAFGEPVFADNCDQLLTITFADVTIPGNCVNKVKQTITRTWTAKDDCNNQVTCSQTITIEDNIAPVLTACPTDNPVLQCYADIPEPVEVTAIDACQGIISVVLEQIESNPGSSCNNIITRTWTATDDCGNSAQCSQTITIQDTQIPILSGIPADVTAECSAIPAPATSVIATDNCDEDVEITFSEKFGTCNNNGKNVNASGNGMVWEIEIGETGLTASDIAKLSLIFEVNKGKGVAEFTLISPSGQGVMLVGPFCNTGECILPGEPHTVYMPVFYKCSEDYDKWNNSNNYPAGVEMNFEPYGGTTSPNEGYIEALLAGEGIAWQGYVQCFDNFTGDMDGTWRIYSRKQEEAIGEVKFIGACLMPGQCPQEYTITRSWTATDDCGNEATESQLIKVVDNTAPTFENCPASVVLGSLQTPNEAQAIAAVGKITDNCGTPDVNAVGGTINDTGNPCVKTQIWTVTAVDECGNIGTCAVTFTITVDEGKPVFFGCPDEPLDLGCNPDLPACEDALGLVSVSDGCTGNVLIPTCSAGPVTGEGCEKTQVFTLTARDDQGHTAICNVTYTWKEDTTPPVLPTLPAGGDLGCNPQVLPSCVGDLMATDLCEGQIPVICTPGSVTGECNKSQTFTYSATDGCGNTASANVTFTWKSDTELPVITTTAVNNTNLGCNPVVTAPVFTGLDNCDGVFTPDVTVMDQTVNGCFHSTTWMATFTDACLNQATPVEITYTWTVDDVAPTLATTATNRDLGCNPAVVAPVFTGADNCEEQISPVVTTSGPTSMGCAYTQSWTANYTDACLNAAVPLTITYTWTVDTDKPVITTSAKDGNDLGCNPAVPVPVFSGTDNCEGTIVPVVTTDGPTHTDCMFTQTWTANYTDACGNAALPVEVTFTWTEDVSDPTFAGCPSAPVDLGLNPAQLPDATMAIRAAGAVTDICGTVEVRATGGSITGDCIRTQIWTVIATDECGNDATCQVIYTWKVDTQVPVINTTAVSHDLGCNPTIVPPVFTGVDDCSVAFTPDVQIIGPTNTGCGYTQTWRATYTDAGSNTAVPVEVTYTWTADVTDPVFSNCPAGFINLGLDPAGLPDEAMAVGDAGTPSDNCGIKTITASGGAITGDCLRTQIWTVTAVDNCGNDAACQVTYTWTVDAQIPLINTTAVSSNLGCNPEVAPPVFTGVDDCSTAFIPVVNTTGPTNAVCAYSQTWTATYTDAGGNAAVPVVITYTWTVDEVAPVFSACPGEVDLGLNPARLPDEDLAIAAAGSVTDLCGMPVVNAEEGPITGDCIRTQTWTVTAIDGCDNQSICQVIFTWTVDTDKPVISTAAKDTNLGCNPVLVPPVFTGLDNCGDIFEPVVNTRGPSGTGCVYTQTWTATYTDGGGNIADPVSVTYTWKIDAEKPVFSACPAGPINLGYNPALPTEPNAIAAAGTVTDLCGATSVSAAGGPVTGGCVKTQTWIVTAVDGCDNVATCQVIFTWTTDGGNPEFTGCPSTPINLGCNPVPPTCADAVALVRVSDGCGGTPAPLCTPGTIVESGCERTQSFALNLGVGEVNTATCVVTYTWTVDTKPPVVTGIPLIEQGCNPVNPTWNYITPTALDDCGPAVLKPGYPVKTNIQADGCFRWKTITWVYVDACGNESDPFVQKLTWTLDPLAPAVTGKTKIDLGCNPENPAARFEPPIATDNCGTPALMNGYPVDGNTITDGCKWSKTRSWKYVDACGNESVTFVQTLTWSIDTEPPAVTGQTVVDLGCNPENPTWKYITPTAVDNCGTVELKTDYPVKTNVIANGCERSKTITWIYVDACGHESAPFVQLLKWTVDTDKPVFASCPVAPVDLGFKPASLPDEAMAIAGAGVVTDLCSPPEVSAIGGIIEGECVMTQVWSVTAEDGCGNMTTCSVTFTWTDDCGFEAHCTYTQGFYGNTGGKTCEGKTSLDLMMTAFRNGALDKVVFGDQAMSGDGKYFKLYYTDITQGNIFKMLPGGGTPSALTGAATYSSPETWGFVPMSTQKNSAGKIQNNLLSQTMVLWFSVQNDPDLGNLVLKDRFMITQKAAECGSNVPLENSFWYTEIPLEVIDFLKAHYPAADVNNLLVLANDVLKGSINTRDLSPAKVATALDAINIGFDECRLLVGFAPAQPDALAIPPAISLIERTPDEIGADDLNTTREFSEANISVYPNPFSTIVKFRVEIVYDTHVRLDIYSHNGSFIGTICDEDLKQGDVRIIEFDATRYPHTTFLYKLVTPYTMKSGTVMRIK